MKSRWRSLANVGKYAVVGTPDAAAAMISMMDKVLPVNAKAFDSDEESEAWRFVGANRV